MVYLKQIAWLFFENERLSRNMEVPYVKYIFRGYGKCNLPSSGIF